MWSDNDIDNAFQRLNPPEPEPAPFPLDGWLNLEKQLDKRLIEHTVRRKLWRIFAAEVAAVALVASAWWLWPNSSAPTVEATVQPREALAQTAGSNSTNATYAGRTAKLAPDGSALAAVAAASSSSALAPSNSPLTERAATSAAESARAATSGVKSSPSQSSTLVPLVRTTAKSVAGTHQPAQPLAAGMTLQATTRRRSSSLRARSTEKASPRPTIAKSGANGIAAAPAARSGVRQSARNGDKINSSIPQPSVSGAATITEDEALPLRPRKSADSSPDASVNALSKLPYRPVVLALPAPPAPWAPVAAAPVADVPAQPPLPVLAQLPRFYVGVVGAPDVTTVKFAHVSSPLLNLGVTLEYRFTNRLRLTTGLLRATKQYVANRDDYNWGGYRTIAYRKDFKEVDGTCTVLDVPLNLRYDAVVQPQYRIFGSVGLSSFFMQRERYSYSYVVNNETIVWERSVVNKNRHLFRIANLSVGYEHSLNSHWSVQAEPYVKVPLSGVGMGKVQLVSGGIFFGAKYGF